MLFIDIFIDIITLIRFFASRRAAATRRQLFAALRLIRRHADDY
jgi:hypothetical protein